MSYGNEMIRILNYMMNKEKMQKKPSKMLTVFSFRVWLFSLLMFFYY